MGANIYTIAFRCHLIAIGKEYKKEHIIQTMITKSSKLKQENLKELRVKKIRMKQDQERVPNLD